MSLSQEYLGRVRAAAPLVHCITNYVTVNDVANALLAVGASPVMSDEPDDVADIAGLASALVLNIGTLNSRSVEAMFAAGRVANARGIPIVLDPVGAGASRMRTETARRILRELRVSAIRCNLSELKALSADATASENAAAGSASATRGVDAAVADAVTEANLPQVEASLMAFARECGCLVAVTGAIDVVCDGSRAIAIRGGLPEMARVTGTGCQLSAICAAFLAANPGKGLEALAAAVASMDEAGETAWSRMRPGDGNATYRDRIIDALYNMGAQAALR